MNLNDKIEFAKKIVVSLVKSPLYSSRSEKSFDQELTLYFQETRILKLNDYFQIKNLFNQSSYFVFKIIKVEPSELEVFRINNVQTCLCQSSSIQDKCIWFGNNEPECFILKEYAFEIKKVLNFYEYFHSKDKITPLLLIHGPSGSGKVRSVETACRNLSFHLCKVNCVNLAGESASAVEKRIEIFVQNSIEYGPCIFLFKSFHFLFKLKDINEFNKRVINSFFNLVNSIKTKTDNRILVVCTTDSKQSINAEILAKFNQEIEIKSLNEEQRCEFLKHQLDGLDKREIDHLVKKTSGLYFGEMSTLRDLVKSSGGSVEEQLAKFQSNRKFQQENKLKIDSIKWGDVGGLGDIKELISDTILLPLKYPGLFKSTESQLGITRSGILLYGPPGTGKTLLAKAISNECALNFLSVKGPELLDMYVGQTEQNVRNLFEKARLNSPCILFFDELDSLAPVRGRAGDSGGVMDRVVSQLLTEIDGMDKLNSHEETSHIFLIGATNRPDLIDQSLLRPGRFDKLVYVPIAKTFEERFKIFDALTKKLPIDALFDKEEFVKSKCPNNLSGADFYAITNKARQNAIKRIISASEIAADNQDEAIIEEDFVKCLEDFNANLSDQELVIYENYFNKFSNKN